MDNPNQDNQGINFNISNLLNSNIDKKDQIIDIFCRTLVHEIKNPLALIKGNMQLLELKYPNMKSNDRWNNIHNNIKQINNILNNFSDFSKMFNVEKKHINIIPIVKRLYNNFKTLANDKNIKFKLNLNLNSNIFILGDNNKLYQVFFNLLKNAFEACNSDDSILINCLLSDQYFDVAICDTGCGMDSEILDSILYPFVTSKLNGTGLGLTLVNYIVQSHNGQLLISSTKGKGSNFTVRLPV